MIRLTCRKLIISERSDSTSTLQKVSRKRDLARYVTVFRCIDLALYAIDKCKTRCNPSSLQAGLHVTAAEGLIWWTSASQWYNHWNNRMDSERFRYYIWNSTWLGYFMMWKSGDIGINGYGNYLSEKEKVSTTRYIIVNQGLVMKAWEFQIQE